MVEIKKIPGGYNVDGLELKNGKCGCTSVVKCCYSWSKVKVKDASLVEFKAKTTSPDTRDNFEWGYKVKKENITVSVDVEDAEDKVIHSGYLPPSVHEWQEKGWDVLESKGDRTDGVIWRCAMCKWLYKETNEGIPEYYQERGACCYSAAAIGCVDNITEAECSLVDGSYLWGQGEVCDSDLCNDIP